jgi:hypothetical protein
MDRHGKRIIGAEPAGTRQATIFAALYAKMRYNISHGDADEYTIAYWSP